MSERKRTHLVTIEAICWVLTLLALCDVCVCVCVCVRVLYSDACALKAEAKE